MLSIEDISSSRPLSALALLFREHASSILAPRSKPYVPKKPN